MKTIKQVIKEYDALADKALMFPTKENMDKLDAKFKEYLELEQAIRGMKHEGNRYNGEGI